VTSPSDDPKPSSAPPGASPAPAPPSRLKRILPFVSLAVGVASALLMDRGPGRAAIVAGAAVSSWATLLLLRWLGRARSDDAAGRERRARRTMVSLAHRVSLLATQSMVQLSLFFALPFYVSAAGALGADPGHLVFLGLLGLLSLASLWDPLTERLLTSKLGAPLLPAAGSFAALAAVLPGLGLSTEQALWVAAGVAAAGSVVISVASAPPEQRSGVFLAALVVGAALPLSLFFGAARIVPAAPLRLVQAEIGTQREGKWITGVATRFAHAPSRLVCATAIASPIGVRDRLFHLWLKDGEPRARVALDIRGGRSAGFRTQSRITLGPRERGVFRCSVVTASDQRLGGVSVKVGEGG
jgi:hypothetical protein